MIRLFRLFSHKPMTQTEAVAKLSQTTNIFPLTSQILALSELEEQGKGQLLNILA